MNPEEFRQIGHQLIDWIADYRAHIADFPVRSQVEPGAVRAQLPVTPPSRPESFNSIFNDLDKILLPGVSHFQSPSFFGYFPSNGELSSVLGDFISTGLGTLGLSWQSSPALTELEELVTDWMRQMVGLSDSWSGVIQDTASTCTLVALICARERASKYSLARGGLQDEKHPLIVYVSSHSHSSVEKAALLAGFGRENLRFIAVDEHYAMKPDTLRQTLQADLEAGLVPCAVVATTGTTISMRGNAYPEEYPSRADSLPCYPLRFAGNSGLCSSRARDVRGRAHNKANNRTPRPATCADSTRSNRLLRFPPTSSGIRAGSWPSLPWPRPRAARDDAHGRYRHSF